MRHGIIPGIIGIVFDIIRSIANWNRYTAISAKIKDIKK